MLNSPQWLAAPECPTRGLPSWSACWDDLCVLDSSHRESHWLPPASHAWTRAMTLTARVGDDAVTVGATSGRDGFLDGASPWRHMAWRRNQVNRPGLEWLASTGRLHAYESQQERRLLQALDFDG